MRTTTVVIYAFSLWLFGVTCGMRYSRWLNQETHPTWVPRWLLLRKRGK